MQIFAEIGDRRGQGLAANSLALALAQTGESGEALAQAAVSGPALLRGRR